MSSAPSFFRREPCPYCGGGPLIFITCPSCGDLLAWCGEEDHAVGRYDGKDLRDLGLGNIREWAHESCPLCKGTEMRHSTAEEVSGLGFTSSEILNNS